MLDSTRPPVGDQGQSGLHTRCKLKHQGDFKHMQVPAPKSTPSVAQEQGMVIQTADTGHKRKRSKATKPRALHLFSGQDNRRDGLAAKLRQAGGKCDDLDIAYVTHNLGTTADNDLLADDLWERIRLKIEANHY